MRHYSRAELEQVYNHFSGTRFPGAPAQGIDILSTAQRYEIGSRLQLGNKVYHYAFVGVGATGLAAGLGAKVRNQQDLGFGAIPATGARAAGSTILLLAIAAIDGPAQDGSFPLNYLRGGTVICRVAGPTSFVRGIVGNPVKAAGAGTLLVTLDAPVPAPGVAVGDQQEAMASPYANVVNGADCIANAQFQPIVGIPTIDAPAGNYTWLQTWGPCVCVGAVAVGGAVDDLLAYGAGNGALQVFATAGGTQQLIGHSLASGVVAGAQGAPFVWLEIDP